VLSIGELAADVGVRTSALRFYEDSGLLTPTARAGGKRRYDENAVERVRFIRFCQQLGFTLAEIRGLLAEPSKPRWRKLVDAKLAELELAVAKAAVVREVLEQSRDCDCITLERCCLVAAAPAL
jgi:DNA-binding transcriptional MerR regulator